MMIAHLLGWIDGADKALTVALNFNGGDATDLFFHTLSSSLSWTPLVLAFLYGLRNTIKGSWGRLALVVLGLAATVTLCDQLSSSVIKPLVMRPRPSHDGAVCGLLHYVGSYRGGAYGFVSSHAANAFGAVTYAAFFMKRRLLTGLAFVYAAAVSYSRVYLGVHYVGDVLGGAVLGIALGAAMGLCVRRLLGLLDALPPASAPPSSLLGKRP